MKKWIALLSALSLSAALLAGCASQPGSAGTQTPPVESTQDASESTPSPAPDPVNVNVVALKGPTAMGMVQFMFALDN